MKEQEERLRVKRTQRDYSLAFKLLIVEEIESGDLPRQSHIKLTIYDVIGREIERLIDDILNSGSFELVWDAFFVFPRES